MKIVVESLGLPALAEVIGRRAEIELEEGTLADLVDRLAARFGPRARRVLLDSQGRLDGAVQVLLNDREFVNREELADRALKEGDSVKFMLLVCGG
jgi:sulfur carrier protein ThiS